MKKILKIFVTGKAQQAVLSKYSVTGHYDGFLLVEADETAATEIAGRYPTEDITDLYTIRSGDRVLDPSAGEPGRDLIPGVHAAARDGGEKSGRTRKHHYLVQFSGPIKNEWLAGVEQAGGELREPWGDFTYVVRLNDRSLAKVSALPYVRWTGHLPFHFRVSSGVRERFGRKSDEISSVLPRTKVIPGRYMIEFFGAEDLRKAIPQVKKLGFSVVSSDAEGKTMTLKQDPGLAADASVIDRLSEIHGVKMIRESSLKRTCNDVAVGLMGTARAMDTGAGGLGLSGKDEYIGICDTGLDTGDPAAIHPDFAGRIHAIRSYPVNSSWDDDITNPGGDDGAADLDSGHGTHVAGSFTGSGASSAGLNGTAGPVRGCAYKAKLVFQAVEQEMKWKNRNRYNTYGRYLLSGLPDNIQALFSYASTRKVRIHSNSWGGGEPGEYDSQCDQVDQFVWDHKYFCILFAAGNDGSDQDGDGKINAMSVTSPGTAKNCITVGATENLRPGFNAETYGSWWSSDYPVAPYASDPMANDPEQVAAFSSRGPTLDNRIKPDVVAPGTFILSTRSTMIAANNSAWSAFPPSRKYFYMGGTSMATPLVAGSVALIREYLRTKKKMAVPSAALLKAALIAGTRQIQGTPAGILCDNDQGYGRVWIDDILAPAAPLSAFFIDKKTGLNTGKFYSKTIRIKSSAHPFRLVMAYSDYPGQSLVNNLNLIVTAPDGTQYCGNQRAGDPLSTDAKNNVEVIRVDQPIAGTWTIRVIAANIPHGPQPFALAGIAEI